MTFGHWLDASLVAEPTSVVAVGEEDQPAACEAHQPRGVVVLSHIDVARFRRVAAHPRDAVAEARVRSFLPHDSESIFAIGRDERLETRDDVTSELGRPVARRQSPSIARGVLFRRNLDAAHLVGSAFEWALGCEGERGRQTIDTLQDVLGAAGSDRPVRARRVTRACQGEDDPEEERQTHAPE